MPPIEASRHIGMSSASCAGDHGSPGFKSQQGRVIFHHKYECEFTLHPYIRLVFHKARKKVTNLAVSTRPKIDDIQMVNMSLFFSPMPATPSTSPTATTTVSE